MGSSAALGGHTAEAKGRRFPRSALANFYLSVGALTVGVYFLLPADAQSVLFVVIALAAGAAASAGALIHMDAGRLPWHLFAAGLFLFGAGDAIFGFYEIALRREPPFPSIADTVYLAGYLPLVVGIFLLIRRLESVEGRYALVDATIIAVGFFVAQWVFVTDPLIAESPTSTSERVALIAYPAMDALLLGALARFFLAPAWRTRAYWYLLLGIVLLLMADEFYAAAPDDYVGGDWIDALWLGSYLFWGASALDSSMRTLTITSDTDDSELSWRRLGLMTAALLAAPTVLAAEVAREDRPEGFLVFAGAAVLAFLVLARGLSFDAYVFQRERTIRLQQNAIRRLTVPLLRAHDQVVVVPLVGILNADRARALLDELLLAVPSGDTKMVVIDFTNVVDVDRAAAEVLRPLFDGTAPLGTSVIVAGLSADLAQSLAGLGIDVSGLPVEPELRAGLERAQTLLGYRLLPLAATPDEEIGGLA